MPPVHGEGACPARIMLVGEAPGPEEELRGRPFVGGSGMFLDECLAAVGLDRRDLFLTNVARIRPPENKIENLFVNPRKMIPGAAIVEGIERLKKEVQRVNPTVIIAMGNTAMWALAEGSPTGILTWRGSHLTTKPDFGSRKVIPTVHPAYVLRQYSDRPLLLADLGRATREQGRSEYALPVREFHLAPRIDAALAFIERCISQGIFSCDIETLGGSITCIGIGLSRSEVICIPLIDPRKPDACYWTEDEETLIWRALRRLFASDAELIGQNFAYDAFWFAMKHGIRTQPKWDLMVMHHVLFSGMRKSLHFMSSLYCKYYRYWKDDGKLWDPRKTPIEDLWRYNCEDLAYTWECYEVVRAMLEREQMMEQYRFQMDEVWPFARDMEYRGVRVNRDLQSRIGRDLLEFQLQVAQQLEYVLTHPLNPRSAPQMKALFYDDLGERPIFNRKTGALTLDDGALETIARRSPHLRRLVQRIQDYRSAGVLHASYALMPLDHDGRARCSFNTTGAETFRFSSSSNPFGSGGNLQTISKGDEDEAHDPGRLVAPNLRMMFEPDPGWTWLDLDIERADLVVVTCEADDDELREMLEKGYNPYKEAAAEYLRVPFERVPHTRYTFMKSFFHGTNYTGKPPTLARSCNMSVHEAELLQRWWLDKHPGISRWHRRLDAALRARRRVQNIFGYRRVYFDRLEGILGEAAGWVGQSTTAIAVNKALTRVWRNLPEVQMLLQVHDSGDMQVRSEQLAQLLPRIRDEMQVTLPYAKPFTFKIGLSLSDRTWGDVKSPKPDSMLGRLWAATENAGNTPATKGMQNDQDQALHQITTLTDRMVADAG